MYKLNGKRIRQDQPFTHNGKQYPANWIRLASYEEKKEIGLYWELPINN